MLDGLLFPRTDLDRMNLRGCLGTHFRNSLKIGRLDKVNPLFQKVFFHRNCLKRQSLIVTGQLATGLHPFDRIQGNLGLEFRGVELAFVRHG